MPPLMASAAAPPTGMDLNAMGGGAGSSDGARNELEGVMGEIRELGQKAEQLAAKMPALASEVQQIRQALKRMITKSAKQASPQTRSAQALPD